MLQIMNYTTSEILHCSDFNQNVIIHNDSELELVAF